MLESTGWVDASGGVDAWARVYRVMHKARSAKIRAIAAHSCMLEPLNAW